MDVWVTLDVGVLVNGSTVAVCVNNVAMVVSLTSAVEVAFIDQDTISLLLDNSKTPFTMTPIKPIKATTTALIRAYFATVTW